LAKLGHHVFFYERDVPYYAVNRDLHAFEPGKLILYREWSDVTLQATRDIEDADVALVTSYCPDGVPATDLVITHARGAKVFYDLDTPITLSRLICGETVNYIGPRLLADFDLVLSFTGGRALDELRTRLGARRARPLYGHVDPDIHRPVPPIERYRADLSYLGTYSGDRQCALNSLFVDAARLRPRQRFLIGGAQYPAGFPWTENIYFVHHLPPDEHPAFFSSSRWTLNVTRQGMAEMGWCPSGRLFEATACQAAVLSDAWSGLSDFFEPGQEIIIVHGTQDVMAALTLSDAERCRIARAGRERTLSEHTADRRARELLTLVEDAWSGRASVTKTVVA
jgi:spore maturation protein CgeB